MSRTNKPIDIDGLEDIIKSFNRMADPMAYVRLDGTVKEVALRLKARAKSTGYAPVKSGALRKSISARKVRMKKDDPSINYTVGPRNYKDIKGTGITGFIILGHRIGKTSKRSKPNDFMRRAAEDMQEEFISLAVKTFTEEIDRLGRK